MIHITCGFLQRVSYQKNKTYYVKRRRVYQARLIGFLFYHKVMVFTLFCLGLVSGLRQGKGEIGISDKVC